MRIPLPEAGPSVTPEVLRLIDALVEENEDFAALAMQAHLPPDGADHEFDDKAWTRRFEISRTLAVQILRRLDRDASQQLAAISYPDHTNMELAAYRAMSLIEGAVRATMIDGPARGATTTNINVSQRTSVAVAVEVGLASIIDRARQIGIDADILSELVDLEESIRAGEPESDRLQRFTRLLERLRPYADLATEFAKFGSVLFG